MGVYFLHHVNWYQTMIEEEADCMELDGVGNDQELEDNW
jgi:hypothetical protein